MSTDRPAPEKKSSPLVLRIVLFVLLAIALVALAIDWKSRSAYNAAFKTLAETMPSDEDEAPTKVIQNVTPLTPEDVHEKIGREPDDVQTTDSSITETYNWKGVIRTYTMTVRYQGKTSPAMDRIE